MTTFARRAGTGAASLAAVAGFALVVAGSAWWQLGDLSEVPLSAEPDYAMRPPQIPAGVETAAGVGCLVVTVAVLGSLVWASARRRVTGRWWLVAAPTALAGYALGVIARVMTAGVIGANIGAGLAVMFIGPVVVVLLLWSVVWMWRLLDRHRRPQPEVAVKPA
jgi:hypothetical protein